MAALILHVVCSGNDQLSHSSYVLVAKLVLYTKVTIDPYMLCQSAIYFIKNPEKFRAAFRLKSDDQEECDFLIQEMIVKIIATCKHSLKTEDMIEFSRISQISPL